MWEFAELVHIIEEFKAFKRAMEKKPEFNVRNFESNKVMHQLNDLREEPVLVDRSKPSKVNVVFVRSLAPKQKEKYVLKVLPVNKEITRSLGDLYWLRSNLCVEFPYYYVS